MHFPVSIRLKVVRRVRNVSQSELAEVLNISQAQVSCYETGVTDIPVRTLCSAAVYLNIPVSRLVTENDERFLSGFNTGTRLLLCRLMTRQTRTEVAATVDISARQLARYEMNQCRIRQSTLSALAAVFEVSCAWLLRNEAKIESACKEKR